MSDWLRSKPISPREVVLVVLLRSSDVARTFENSNFTPPTPGGGKLNDSSDCATVVARVLVPVAAAVMKSAAIPLMFILLEALIVNVSDSHLKFNEVQADLVIATTLSECLSSGADRQSGAYSKNL